MVDAEFWRFSATISATMIGLVFVGTFYYLDSGWESFKYFQGELEALSMKFARLIIAYFSTVLLVSIVQEPFFPRYVPLIAFLGLAIATGAATKSVSDELEGFYDLSNNSRIRGGNIGNWIWFLIVFIVPLSVYLWNQRPDLLSAVLTYPVGASAVWVVFLALILGYWYLLQLLFLPYQTHKRERDISERENKQDVRKGKTPTNQTWDDDQVQLARKRVMDGLQDEGLTYQADKLLSGELDEPALHSHPRVTDLGDAMVHVQIPDDWASDLQLLNKSCVLAQNVGVVALDSHYDLTGVEVRIWRRQLLPEKERPDDLLILKLRWEHNDLDALDDCMTNPEEIRESASEILYNTGLFPKELVN